jgi:transcriptional regulator with XRE-family HTH domain
MDTLVDDTETSIARRIRLERDARNWSLAELAEKSGVAKASISKIERGEMSPSAGILARLAAAFDLTLAGLLLKAETEKGRLYRAAEQQIWRDPATGYVRRQIFGRPDHPLEVVRVELPPGKSVSFPSWSYTHLRHVVWVQSGKLTLSEGGARNVLSAGDSLGFGPPSDVTYANDGDSPCIYTVALSRS